MQVVAHIVVALIVVALIVVALIVVALVATVVSVVAVISVIALVCFARHLYLQFCVAKPTDSFLTKYPVQFSVGLSTTRIPFNAGGTSIAGSDSSCSQGYVMDRILLCHSKVISPFYTVLV